MADYSLGGGFNSGYGSGGLGLGGGYGGNRGNNSGLGLGGGNNNYGGGRGGGYGLADGYTGSSGLGLNTSASGGGYYDNAGNYSLAPSWWGIPAFAQPNNDSSGGFTPSSFSSPPSYGFSKPHSAGLGFKAPATDTAPVGPPAWSGMTGLQMPSGKTGYGLTGGDDPNPGFWGSDFGRMLRKAGLFALQVHPATRGAMALYGALTGLTDGKVGQTLGGIVGQATNNPLLGNALGIGLDAASGKPVGQRTGSMLGGLFGGVAGGPMGAMLGREAGSYIGQGYDEGKTTPAGPTPSQNRGTEGNASALLGGAMQLYGLNRIRDMEKQNAAQLQQQQAALEAMFAPQASQAAPVAMPHAPAMRSPDMAGVSRKLDAMFGTKSESAQTLRSQLERADAAAGRRSQYGPREVELLARLAQLRAQTEPNYMNAEVGAANAANQHAYSVYAAQMQAANAQAQMRQQELQRAMAARQGMMGNQASINQARLAAEQRRMQQLTTLYGMGRESGLFNYIGGMFE